MIRAILIAIVVAVVGSLEVTAQPVINQKLDSLSLEFSIRDSIHKLEIERLDSLVKDQADQIKTIKLLKSQREELLDEANRCHNRTLSLLQIVLAIVALASGYALWRVNRSTDRFDKKLSEIDSAEKKATSAFNRIAKIEEAARKNADRISKRLPDTKEIDKKSFDKEKLESTSEAYEQAVQVIESVGGKLSELELFTLGKSHYISNDNLSALEIFDKLLRINPKKAEYWIWKGLALDELERYEESYEAYKQSSVLEPMNSLAWTNYGFSLIKLKKYDKALEILDKAIEIDKNEETAIYNKACTYALMKKQPEMIEWLTNAINTKASNKEKAKTDPDFAYYRDEIKDREFRELIGLDNNDTN